MKEKISVIMAAYNAERFIKEAVESVLAQSFMDYELLIVADGPADNTMNIVKELKKTDDRIKLVDRKKGWGPAAARNAALKVAKGKYIAILDSDDIALPNRLEIQYKYLEENPDVFFCAGSSIIISEEGKVLGKKRSVKKITKALPYFNPFCHSTIMYRNEGYMYREKIEHIEDYDFFLLLFSDGKKLVNLNEFLSYYRIHKDWKVSQYFYYSGLKVKQFFRERMETGKDSYDKFKPSSIKPKTESYTSGGVASKMKLGLWSNYFIRTFAYDIEAWFPEITIMLVKMVENSVRKAD